MSPSLPPRPNLEWLKKTAKGRLELLRRSNPKAKLADAQLEVSREYGFSSWRALKRHLEALHALQEMPDEESVAVFLRRVGQGRIDDVRDLLKVAPLLINAIGPHPFWGGRPQALHVAIEGKRSDMFHLLLEHGADVNGSNTEYDHWSPLMLAIDREVTAMQEELIARGARIGLLEALMLADDARVGALLASGGLPEIAPNAGSILSFARTTFAIDRLIELGAPTQTRDRWGSTPVDGMSRLGTKGETLVRHMVARGLAASARDYARLGDLNMLARLVEGDAAIARDDSVMMGAVDFGHRAVVEWLLAHGASVNARSDAESRHTALHSAAWNGDLDMVKLLVAAGADRHARDAQYDAPPRGWAETSIEVSNNPKCADVVAYFDTLT
jgi:ankyrin repeat protein